MKQVERPQTGARHDQKDKTESLKRLQGQSGIGGAEGDKTLAEIAQQYDVHPNQVTEWKRQLLERAADVFESGSAAGRSENEPDIKTLHAKIGQLALENE